MVIAKTRSRRTFRTWWMRISKWASIFWWTNTASWNKAGSASPSSALKIGAGTVRKIWQARSGACRNGWSSVKLCSHTTQVIGMHKWKSYLTLTWCLRATHTVSSSGLKSVTSNGVPPNMRISNGRIIPGKDQYLYVNRGFRIHRLSRKNRDPTWVDNYRTETGIKTLAVNVRVIFVLLRLINNRCCFCG